MDIIERLKDPETIDTDDVATAIRVIEAQAYIIQKHVKHSPGCLSLERVRGDNGQFSTYGCNCGLTKLMDKLKRLREIGA